MKFKVILFQDSEEGEKGHLTELPFAPTAGLWLENPFGLEELSEIDAVYWVTADERRPFDRFEVWLKEPGEYAIESQ